VDKFISTFQVRHVYRLKWWAQLLYLTLGVSSGGYGFVLITQTMSGDRNDSADLHVFMFSGFLIVLGCYFVALATRSRVVLDATTISVRGAFLEKTVNLCDITGYRILQTRFAAYWQLELKGYSSYISIMCMFNVDDDFRALLSHLKNLEADDRKMFNFPS